MYRLLHTEVQAHTQTYNILLQLYINTLYTITYIYKHYTIYVLIM